MGLVQRLLSFDRKLVTQDAFEHLAPYMADPAFAEATMASLADRTPSVPKRKNVA